jgi:hypothetical protein
MAAGGGGEARYLFPGDFWKIFFLKKQEFTKHDYQELKLYC